MTYRFEITDKSGASTVQCGMTRGEVRDRVDSVLFNIRQGASRIESIYIRFTDGTKVVVIQE